MSKKLKVFHGPKNYGTQAGLFARELRKRGVQSISVTEGDKFERVTDVELLRGGNFLAKVFKHSWNVIRKFFWFFKYNTFHFYFGRTLFKRQIDLPFYKLFGKKVLMEYLGNDIRHYKTLVEEYNLSENHVYFNNMEKHDDEVKKRTQFETRYIDYLTSCLPTHVEFAKVYNVKVKEVIPLALDIKKIDYFDLKKKDKKECINILHAPTNRIFKGTDYIIEAVDRLKKEDYNISLNIAENITHSELFEEYNKCDIFIDQISVGWYGTAALEAMAVGRPVCAFIDDKYFKHIDYSSDIPIVNVTKENIFHQLKELLDNSDELPKKGAKGREFVEKYHDVEKVTDRLLDIYENILWVEQKKNNS
ncbi:MAG: glycosyltransferase [Balneola sp.]